MKSQVPKMYCGGRATDYLTAKICLLINCEEGIKRYIDKLRLGILTAETKEISVNKNTAESSALNVAGKSNYHTVGFNKNYEMHL